MKHMVFSLVLLLALPGVAQAACYAGYKAKQDDPLRLHYGVMQTDTCDRGAAQREVADRLQGTGWTLLNIVELGPDTPTDQQRENAGEHFLRY